MRIYGVAHGRAAPLQIGELARAAGVTVRTLHHYDAIGLLVPAERSCSGRRLYGAAEVRRLYRIVALKRLGLGLPEIAALLDGDPDLEAAIRRHLAVVQRDLELGEQLRAALTTMLERLHNGGEPTLDEVMHTIEVMKMSEKHYTPSSSPSWTRAVKSWARRVWRRPRTTGPG